eukprot:g47522.t1
MEGVVISWSSGMILTLYNVLPSIHDPLLRVNDLPSVPSPYCAVETNLFLLEELKNLQKQYVRIGEETAELSQLRTQLEAQNQQIAEYRDTQEQLKKESVSYHEELGQLRSEKSSFTKQCERLKEQYLIAVSDKDKQIQELQSLCQELRLKVTQQAPEDTANPGEILKGLQTENSQLKSQLNNSLKELHQKELRIQKLNSKISLVFEEKVALSAQLRGTGQSLRDTQHRFNELQARHLTLEQQLQSSADLLEEKKLNPMTDAAPGGPQEKGQDEEHVKELELRHLKQRLLEAKQMHDRTEQELNQLEGSLAEEREKRLAAEEALLSAEHRLKSVELSEWVNAQERSLNTSAMEEHSMLIELPESATPSKTRRGSRWDMCYVCFDDGNVVHGQEADLVLDPGLRAWPEPGILALIPVIFNG